MKRTILFLIATVFAVTIKAQNKIPGDTHLLKHYYELKEALVNSDALTASYKIADVTTAGATKISETTLKKLVAARKDLDKQRESFSRLSVEMYQLVKKEKQTSEIIYQAYCPMKKMYWLSKDAIIRNPYYGKSMLNCGNVTETIKP